MFYLNKEAEARCLEPERQPGHGFDIGPKQPGRYPVRTGESDPVIPREWPLCHSLLPARDFHHLDLLLQKDSSADHVSIGLAERSACASPFLKYKSCPTH